MQEVLADLRGLELRGRLGHQVPVVLVDLLAQGHLVFQALQARRVHQVQVALVLRGRVVLRDQVGLREAQAQQVHQDRVVPLVVQALRGPQAVLAHQGLVDQRVVRGRLDQAVHRGQQVMWVQLEVLVHLDRVVRQDQVGHLDQ